MSDTLFHRSTGQGSELVLIHGWGLNHGIWTPLVERLQHRFRVTVLDLPGFGLSQKPVRSDYDFEWVCDQVETVLPANSTVLGWSLGGLVAQRLAMRGNGDIRALITVASSPKFEGDSEWPGIQPNVLAMFQKQLSQDFAKTLERFLAIQAMGSSAPKQDLKRIKALIEGLPMPQLEALKGGLEILHSVDLRAQCSQISVPCLRMYGRLDSLVPEKAIDLIGELHTQCEQRVLPKASHGPFISHPDEFEQHLLQWLQALAD